MLLFTHVCCMHMLYEHQQRSVLCWSCCTQAVPDSPAAQHTDTRIEQAAYIQRLRQEAFEVRAGKKKKGLTGAEQATTLQ